jgi:hypothetical protein
MGNIPVVVSETGPVVGKQLPESGPNLMPIDTFSEPLYYTSTVPFVQPPQG